MTRRSNTTLAVALALVLCSPRASAHCDSLDGPVVQDARSALERRDPTPVLKWVAKADEQKIREAFEAALAVRALGSRARQVADQHFFETLVRIHRAGEGEAFTGLKAAGTADPAIAAADAALASGSGSGLAARVSEDVRRGVERRFALAQERREHADDSVDAGRRYVAAYVDYIHFVENAIRLAEQGAPHTHQEPPR